jgi:hypothetical protein
MQRIRTLQHMGKEILVLDYGGLGANQYMDVARQAMALIATKPRGTVLTVTVVTGTRFSVGTADEIKRYATQNRPFVKASAVVGLSALQRIIFAAVRPFLAEHVATFDAVPDALAWLVQQP